MGSVGASRSRSTYIDDTTHSTQQRKASSYGKNDEKTHRPHAEWNHLGPVASHFARSCLSSTSQTTRDENTPTSNTTCLHNIFPSGDSKLDSKWDQLVFI